MVPAARELADAAALRVHHEDVGAARAITDERDLLSRRRPRGLGVDAGVSRESPQRTGGQREHVDFGITVLGQRHRQRLAVWTPGGRGVDADEGRQRLLRPALERERPEEIWIAVLEGRI